MSSLSRLFDDARNVLKNRRTCLLLLVTAFMGVDAAVVESLKHNYVKAILALVFFLVVFPWSGWNYIKPQD